jgi:histidinol-phosphatase (PHP family)
MSREGTDSYIREVRSLTGKYSESIRVLTGIERDYYADISNEGFDYVIGSLHYLFLKDSQDLGSADSKGSETSYGRNRANGDAIWTDVDDNPEKLINFASRHFGGDLMCLAELYYEILQDIVSVTDCDIIGHLDLITKFNERFALDGQGRVVDLHSEAADVKKLRPLFDTSDERYIAAWRKAIDSIFEETVMQRCGIGERSHLSAEGSLSGEERNVLHPNRLETLGLLRAGDRPVFEINTGAISRGYRTTPYPAPDQIE